MTATTQDYLEAAVLAMTNSGGGSAPTGALSAFAGTTIPDGWLLCNGAAVSRTTYADLFAVIGTKWGTGDGSTTFNLPNCNNRFLEGTTSTSSVGTYLSAGLPNITGSADYIYIRANANCFTGALSGNYATSSAWSAGTMPSINQLYFNASGSDSIYGSKSTVQPPSAYVLIIIKT